MKLEIASANSNHLRDGTRPRSLWHCADFDGLEHLDVPFPAKLIIHSQF